MAPRPPELLKLIADLRTIVGARPLTRDQVGALDRACAILTELERLRTGFEHLAQDAENEQAADQLAFSLIRLLHLPTK